MKKSVTAWVRTAALLGALLAGVGFAGTSVTAFADEVVETGLEGSININTASAEQLQALPGIGPSKAQAIIALRERHGGFRRVEQILHVRGIGRATFRKLRGLLSVEGETTLEASGGG